MKSKVLNMAIEKSSFSRAGAQAPTVPEAGPAGTGVQPGAPSGRMRPDLNTARERLLQVEKALNSMIIGHEDAILALLVGLVAREHVVLIGPPGTAKTFLVKTLARLLNARHYSYLLTRFTSYDEVFGAIDITALTRGEYKRNWSRIINSEIVFLDEIFKANSAILNALLSLLQERIVYDPLTGTEVKASLHTAVGASNEVPEDAELQALYDRFAIRVFVDYLNTEDLVLKALEARWNGNGATITAVASMNDVQIMHDYAMTILVSRVKELEDNELWRVYHKNTSGLLKELKKNGFIVSDRMYIEKLPRLVAAYLALRGVTVENIMNAPYDLLPFLAHTASEKMMITQFLTNSLGEIAELSRKLEEAKKQINAWNFATARSLLEEILSFDMNKLAEKSWLKPRAEAILASARDILTRMNQRLEGWSL